MPAAPSGERAVLNLRNPGKYRSPGFQFPQNPTDRCLEKTRRKSPRWQTVVFSLAVHDQSSVGENPTERLPNVGAIPLGPADGCRGGARLDARRSPGPGPTAAAAAPTCLPTERSRTGPEGAGQNPTHVMFQPLRPGSRPAAGCRQATQITGQAAPSPGPATRASLSAVP